MRRVADDATLKILVRAVARLAQFDFNLAPIVREKTMPAKIADQSGSARLARRTARRCAPRVAPFLVKNLPLSSFPGWAAAATAQAVSGDFSRDGRDDVALVGGTGWATIPVALSNGIGGFTVVNEVAGDFPTWATWSGVQAIVADLNGDRRDDIILTSTPGC